MHPVTSELDLSIRQYERHLEALAVQRAQATRAAARHAGRVSLVSRISGAVRQVLDPRGYALAQALRIGSPATPAGPARPRPATITPLPLTSEADSTWREAA